MNWRHDNTGTGGGQVQRRIGRATLLGLPPEPIRGVLPLPVVAHRSLDNLPRRLRALPAGQKSTLVKLVEPFDLVVMAPGSSGGPTGHPPFPAPHQDPDGGARSGHSTAGW